MFAINFKDARWADIGLLLLVLVRVNKKYRSDPLPYDYTRPTFEVSVAFVLFSAFSFAWEGYVAEQWTQLAYHWTSFQVHELVVATYMHACGSKQS